MTRALICAALMCVSDVAFAAEGVSGNWTSGDGPSTRTYVLKMQAGGFVGAMCGPCDDPSSVFRITDGKVIDAAHVTFSIVREGKASPPSTVTLKRVGGGEPVETQLLATVKSDAPPARANQPVLDGRWVAVGRAAQQNVTLKLRDGNKVWGVICGPCNPAGVFLIEDGALEGDAISFFIHHFETPAATGTPNGVRRNFMKGTITGNVMKFKWVREGRETEPGGDMALIGPIRQ